MEAPKEEHKFKKREGTSGISGHLYETKLLSLLNFRAIHYDKIKKFQIASNVDGMGAFDDICFHADVEGFDKPILVFVQAKHRENLKQIFKIDLPLYFNSYLEVRQQYSQGNKDLFFKGIYDENECFFVLYTNASDEFGDEFKVESGVFSILDDLIGTGGTAKQPYKVEENNPQTQTIQFLCEVTMKEHMISLAERMAKLINNDANFQIMMTDELIQRYHVVLAQKVFEVTEIKSKPPVHRIATFRPDFFAIDEEYLTIFKDTLIKQVLMKRKIKPNDAKKILSLFLTNPLDAAILSKLVGTIIPYNNGQLVFDDKLIHDKPEIKKIDVPQSIVDKAVELAAKEILLSAKFKLRVPTSFGNKDLTLSGNNERQKKRIKHLSSHITPLLEKCTTSGIVTIEETLGDGLLHINGGLAGAIGNLLVLDDDTKLLKITTDVDSLGPLAKNLYDQLNEDIEMFNKNSDNNKILSLSEYKFRSKVYTFPKLLMGYSEEAEDFLNKLVIYSNQSDEDAVGDLLKSEIEANELNQPNYLQVRTDSIFSKYHEDMLTWWKLADQAPILSRENDYFQMAKQSIIKDPLLGLVAAMYHRQKIPINFTFTEDAVSSLTALLQPLPSNTVIITENSILTVVKVLQYFKNKDHYVLDMEYIVGLPPNDRILLREELAKIDDAKLVILVCDNVINDRNKILETISKAVLGKTTIIIANNASVKILQKYFTNPPVHEDKNSLIDMCEESQKSIIENARVMFQDTEVTLDLIVNEKSKKYVKNDILMKIIRGETIAIGKLIVKENYNEIKPLYIDRRLRKTGNDADIVVNIFNNNLTDNVVLVTAEPGMGKSTLLTHLSINTKEFKPDIWIVRVNLLEYSREFSEWTKEENTVIDILEIMKFLCQVILRDKLGKENKVEITLEEKDNVIYLKHCTADPLIELELNLFLHFYYERDMIFLFDGFDEICPHYMDVVLKCLKCFRDHNKQRMWITSRGYNEIKTLLEEEFGLSYEILHYTNVEMIKYLTTFWKNDFNPEKIKSTQLENVKKFLDYMAAMENKRIPFSKPLNAVFKVAACHLDFEITNCYNFCDKYSVDELHCDVNPLFLFLSALFVADNIENKNSKEWYLEVDTFKIYVRFLEIKIKRRYQKNDMNIHNPDIIIAYNKDITESIVKHKKFGAYAIFHKLNTTLFSEEDVEEMKEMIKELEKGEDKPVLIDSVANGIPIFTHMSFTEYFAVEYVCDRLKKENNNEKLNYFYMIFAQSVLFNERKIFNHKLNFDKTLMNVLDQNEDVIFNWMQSLSGVNSPQVFAIICANNEELNNIRCFFEKIINKNKANLSNKTTDQKWALGILNMTLNMGKYFVNNENNALYGALDSLFAGSSVLTEGYNFDYTVQ